MNLQVVIRSRNGDGLSLMEAATVVARQFRAGDCAVQHEDGSTTYVQHEDGTALSTDEYEAVLTRAVEIIHTPLHSVE